MLPLARFPATPRNDKEHRDRKNENQRLKGKTNKVFHDRKNENQILKNETDKAFRDRKSEKQRVKHKNDVHYHIGAAIINNSMHSSPVPSTRFLHRLPSHKLDLVPSYDCLSPKK